MFSVIDPLVSKEKNLEKFRLELGRDFTGLSMVSHSDIIWMIQELEKSWHAIKLMGAAYDTLKEN